ncbi:MAG: hypothetical protein Q9187_005200 [Circinaria calcarea]
MGATDGEPRRNAPSDVDDNPFIAFRRFADEQMSSLLRGIVGLPSAFTSNSHDPRWSDEGESRRSSDPRSSSSQSSREWGPRRPDEANHASSAIEIPVKKYSQKLERKTHETEVPRNPRWPSTDELPQRSSSPRSVAVKEDEELRCPYRPVHQDVQQRPYSLLLPYPRLLLEEDLPFSGGMLPRHLNEDGAFRPLGAWPIGFVAMSPYSPLQLERQERLRHHGAKWRNAFEDLLAVQSGREMVEEKQRPQEQGSSSEWVRSMLERGLLGPFKPIGASNERLTELSPPAKEVDPRRLEHDAQENETTELDLYERFLGTQGQLPISPSSITTRLLEPSTERAGEDEHTGIISTLTTTERKMLPNGTVHTKVILKKRFADGREESSETLHTTQRSSLQKSQSTIAAQSAERVAGEATAGEGKTQEEKKEKMGWFWS